MGDWPGTHHTHLYPTLSQADSPPSPSNTPSCLTRSSTRRRKCPIPPKKGDGNFLKARQEAKKGELDEQLREYINEWRKQRAKEEEELKRLKEKQAKRKEIRAEQEKKLAQQKKEEEERLRKKKKK